MSKNKKSNKSNTFSRLIKMLFSSYPVLLPFVIFCIVVSAVVSAIPSIFQQKVLAIITKYVEAGNFDWAAASAEIIPLISVLIVLYIISIILLTTETQIMAGITQGFLDKTRRKLFNGMQNLPLSYFDTHQHGDIMSHYTNDIDTLRQMISQAFPNIIKSAIIVFTVLCIMLWYSFIMTGIVLVGIVIMVIVSKKIGGGSAKYFIRQQESMGKAEGYIQEMMNGQKVIKVFNHEDEAIEDFDEINNQLFNDAFRAHAFANSLGPIIMNIGNVLYVIVATLGGLYLISDLPSYSISGMAFSIAILVPYLNMTKQFTGNLNQVSQQINNVVMALAGAKRIFDLMDQEPEVDEGQVSLVRCTVDCDECIHETEEYSGKWAWKVPQADGSYKHVLLKGDMRLIDVDFGYNPEKEILHNISVYAEPGQKVAFVGSTGAGKTTIINLLNRFYDITNGLITVDGINVKEIRKSDLRRSLGIVLQDTNLFTGTVYDNIRYGNLDATDAECEAAAKLVGANTFIERLPDGYQTELANNGSNLSQGQRQLISIARAAVADPPILILDEATSSIDTRTEATVQRGMDMLMHGRTVFVIAHRLSTVMNSDVIMVMEHGRIIERGTHQDLLEQKGTYYQLYTGAFELE